MSRTGPGRTFERPEIGSRRNPPLRRIGSKRMIIQEARSRFNDSIQRFNLFNPFNEPVFAAIYIPNFPLQSVLRHEPELIPKPVVLTDPALTKPSVTQLTPAARASGICQGMTPSQAMARCGNLAVKTRSLPQEQAAMETLMQTAYAFSPHIEATAPGVCTMELKGLSIQTNQTSSKQWAAQI